MKNKKTDKVKIKDIRLRVIINDKGEEGYVKLTEIVNSLIKSLHSSSKK